MADAVLDELVMKGWKPSRGEVLDWGYGSGIAGRRVIGRLGSGAFSSLSFWDHSPEATDFAQDMARRAFPGLSVVTATPDFLHGTEPNRASCFEPCPQRAYAARASRGPGTHRALGSIRDKRVGDFHIVAPCTHEQAFPILGEGNERHWCHHFAAPPSAIFADSNWVKFGQRAGIDLRSLPYTFIALDREWLDPAAALSRAIGRPEHFKPYARLLNCDADGLQEMTVMKRDNSPLYKELDKAKGPLVYRWTREGSTIKDGSRPVTQGQPG